MKSSALQCTRFMQCLALFGTSLAFCSTAIAQHVSFFPYVQLGDDRTFGRSDQIVIAWQTDESAPDALAYTVRFRAEEGEARVVRPSARVVDNYLSADPALPSIAGAYGPHSNYTAVLRGLSYDTDYHYVVKGPGIPDGGFSASFHTRKRTPYFSFAVEGDEGFFPPVPNSDPARSGR